MYTVPENFQLEELVCPEVFSKYGYQAWSFFDPRILITLETVRRNIGKPIIINTWKDGGTQTQSGLRCNLCSLVKEKTDAGELYLSAHIRGMAFDYSVEGMTAEEVRQWLVTHQNILPYPIRLEKDVAWVHMDVASVPTLDKITFFNS